MIRVILESTYNRYDLMKDDRVELGNAIRIVRSSVVYYHSTTMCALSRSMLSSKNICTILLLEEATETALDKYNGHKYKYTRKKIRVKTCDIS